VAISDLVDGAVLYALTLARVLDVDGGRETKDEG
jgi:hypothetical protein